MILHFLGGHYDQQTIEIEWSDHNNVRHTATLEISTAYLDKPRTLVISVNDRVVFRDPSLVQSEVRDVPESVPLTRNQIDWFLDTAIRLGLDRDPARWSRLKTELATCRQELRS